jgi:hypothetical protein
MSPKRCTIAWAWHNPTNSITESLIKVRIHILAQLYVDCQKNWFIYILVELSRM